MTRIELIKDRMLRECEGQQPKSTDPGYSKGMIYATIVDRYNDMRVLTEHFLKETDERFRKYYK